PAAEESGLICPIGNWVIETVCGDLERWRAERREIVPVSINVSSRQFAEADMSRVIADALTRHGLDPRSLEIELTESSILEVDVLMKIGCDAVQGFVFSPAIPEREFAELLVSSARSSPAAETPDAAGAQDAREAADPLLPAVRADDAALRAAPIEIETAPPRVQVTADPPAEVRLLVVDDGTTGLGVLAMRLNRMGATAIYASNEDEGLLFTSEQGAAIRALVVHSDSDVASIHRLVGRIAEMSGGAPAILFVGDDVAKPLLDLRSRCRIWS